MRMDKDTQTIEGNHSRASFLLCVPTLGTVDISWVVGYTRLAVPVNAINHSLVVTKQEVGVARNHMVETALNMNPRPEAILMYGDDMLPSWTALLQLYEAFREGQYDVLAGLYYVKNEYPLPIIWRRDIVGPMKENIHYKPGEVVDCDVVGMDFTLLRPSIFDKLEKPYFKTGPTKFENRGILIHTEDVWACDAIKAAGGRVGCHTGVRVSHLYASTGEIF